MRAWIELPWADGEAKFKRVCGGPWLLVRGGFEEETSKSQGEMESPCRAANKGGREAPGTKGNWILPLTVNAAHTSPSGSIQLFTHSALSAPAATVGADANHGLFGDVL
ncbi:hypothetical protein WMY93_026175 [Mugilogobius chulae]|uniref:Uncharacterized protein n=1 Tax=Mugilogobius chulae TaxID=88201 RepID=A0AAW0MY98_9GOBI